MFGQSELRRELDRRIESLTVDAVAADEGCVVAVVADFEPVEFVRACLEFSTTLSADEFRYWCANFTRTIFLAGHPANLSVRYPPDHVSERGDIAWYGPRDTESMSGVRRLLRPFHGPVLIPAGINSRVTPREGEASESFVLTVDVSDMVIEEFMIHVNHVVAESAFAGILHADTALVLKSVSTAEFTPSESQYLRISADQDDAGRLRCYAALSRN